ncbi:MAG: FtsH protease activity modulator HflK [Candidatus Cloacimonadales bacterium]
MENFEDVKVNSRIPKFSKKKVLGGIILIAIIVFVATGLYTVNPEEVGVIRRFGKYVNTTQPGLHFKIPFGVDNLTKVKVKEVYKQEFGFRTVRAGVKSQFSSRSYEIESIMLTGDLNIAEVEWIVQYRIQDPVKYLFNVRSVEETLRDVAESVMRLYVGDRSVDEVIVLNRKEIADKATITMQEQLREYGTGLEIMTINLQNVNPPETVRPAFNNVNSSKQEKEKIINQAWQQYNNIIPEAKGKAKRVIEEAEGYAIERENRANGDATRFVDMYNSYRTAKTVTKKRMYLETMQRVLPRIEKTFIVDEDQSGILPLLDLNKGGK